MARTKQEVRDFLNSLVGSMVNEKCGIYNGQCVSLIKALLEFLGVANPYSARGNAKDFGNTLINQGIAKAGSGWLNVCINRDMGRIFEDGVWNIYGHIWIDVAGEMNIEQNGRQALRTTKNTRPITQAQQIVNLDQYIEGDNMPTENEVKNYILAGTGAPASNTQIKYYTVRPWSVLALDLMNGLLAKNKPTVEQVIAYVKKFQFRDITAKEAEFYAVRPWQNLIDDLKPVTTNSDKKIQQIKDILK